MADFDLGGLLFGNAPSSGLEGYLDPEQLRRMQQQGVMQAAMALLKASGPSTQRVGLGQALGGAYEAGQAGYQQAQQQGLAGLLTKQKMDEALRKKRLEEFFMKGIAPTGAGTPSIDQTAMPTMAVQPLAMPDGAETPIADGSALPQVNVSAPKRVKPSIFSGLSQEQRLLAAMDPDKAIPKLFEESLKQESFDTVTGVEAQAWNLDPRGTYSVNNRTGQVTTIKAPGASFKIVTGVTAENLGLPSRGRWQVDKETGAATLVTNPEGPFGGGVTGGAYDILLNAPTDSPQYALAYREVNKPILQDQVQPDGSVKQVLVTPAPLPSTFPKPTFKGRGEPVTAVAMPQVTQPGAAAAPATQITPTAVRPVSAPAAAPSAAAPVTAMTSPADIPSGTKSTPYAPTSEQVGQAKKQIGTAVKLYSAIDELEKDIVKNGLQTFGLGEAGGRQGAYFQDTLLQLKELQNLGVLNGPDERILLQELADPTSLATRLKGGSGYVMAKIKVLKEKAVREANLINSQFPKPVVNLPSSFTAPAGGGSEVQNAIDAELARRAQQQSGARQ
jgi:hypothetical protein